MMDEATPDAGIEIRDAAAADLPALIAMLADDPLGLAGRTVQ